MSSLFSSFSLQGTTATSTETFDTGHVRIEHHVEQISALIQKLRRFTDSSNQSATWKASCNFFVVVVINKDSEWAYLLCS